MPDKDNVEVVKAETASSTDMTTFEFFANDLADPPLAAALRVFLGIQDVQAPVKRSTLQDGLKRLLGS